MTAVLKTIAAATLLAAACAVGGCQDVEKEMGATDVCHQWAAHALGATPEYEDEATNVEGVAWRVSGTFELKLENGEGMGRVPYICEVKDLGDHEWRLKKLLIDGGDATDEALR